MRANHFYKQGYILLEQDEYPQSEMYFNKAVDYRYNKKWFFKYARGYREHKQYQRAERMYERADSKVIYTGCLTIFSLFLLDCIMSALYRTPITY